jgi:CSLREA domain-containing protein
MKNNQPVVCIMLFVLMISVITGPVLANTSIPANFDHDVVLQGLLNHEQSIFDNSVSAPASDLELSPLRSSGTTYTVTTTVDYDYGNCVWVCSLRDAVALADSGDTIQFADSVVGGTITLQHEDLGPPVPIIIDKDLTIDNSNHANKVTISGNNYSGIFVVNNGINLTLKNLKLIESQSIQGAVYNNLGNVEIFNSHFESNGHSNASGGAVRNHSGSVSIQQSFFYDNQGKDGGAIYNAGDLEIYDSTFESNAAIDNGGAIFNNINATALIIERSTFEGNTTSNYDGGAIWNGDQRTARVTNCTFVGNQAEQRGGGIYSIGYLYVTTSSFSENGAESGNGAGIHARDDLFLYNSILANSATGYDCMHEGSGWDVNNLIENNSPAPHACGTPISTADPVLGVLKNNGGDTDTMALGSVSPAIDAGFSGNDTYGNPYCPPADQRKVGRPQNSACDLGAYEVVSTPFVLSSIRSDANPTYSTSVDFTVSFSNAVIGVDISDFTLTTTGVSGASVSQVTGSGHEYTVTALRGTGIGTIRLDVIDDDTITSQGVPLGGTGAGNGDFYSGQTYLIDRPPTFTSSPVLLVNVNTQYNYHIVSTDPDLRNGDTLDISSKSLPGWLILIPGDVGEALLTGTPDREDFGDHPISLFVIDSLGLRAAQNFTIRVNRAPRFTSSPVTQATADQVYSYSVTTTDPDGDNLSITSTDKPDWLTLTDHGTGSATLSGTPLDADHGEHNVTLRVTDGNASTTQTFTITVIQPGNFPYQNYIPLILQ